MSDDEREPVTVPAGDGVDVPAALVEAAARRSFGDGASGPRLVIGIADARVNGRIAAGTLFAGARRREVVVKVVAAGLREAEAYVALAAGGAPVAELLAWCTVDDGCELLILERLPRVGIDGGDHEFGLLVDALARFNAVPASTLTVVTPSWVQDWLDALSSAWQRARSGAWGEPMREAATMLDDRWPQVQRVADEVQGELAKLPLEPTHQDPNHENCGWRADGSLVLFDLSSTARYPAFADLALVLGGATQPWPAAHGRWPWVERYCAARARHGRVSLSPQAVESAVALHLAATAMWFDAVTLERSHRRFTAEPPAAAGGVLAWYERKWRRLARMAEVGIAGAG